LRDWRIKEGSVSFLNKSKKPLLNGGFGHAGARALSTSKFFASFCSQKEVLALLASRYGSDALKLYSLPHRQPLCRFCVAM
jgi:hypothetical protein